MLDLFPQVRAIPAHEAARRLGISITRKGDHLWACCPIHGERTASLCFYPDGHFYCFGCHAGGSSVDLYQAVLGLRTPLEAAQKAASDFGLSGELIDSENIGTRHREKDVMRTLDRGRILEENQLCEAKRRAAEIAATKNAQTAWDDPEFLTAMDALCYAQDRLAQTLAYDIGDYAEEQLEEAGIDESVRSARS